MHAIFSAEEGRVSISGVGQIAFTRSIPKLLAGTHSDGYEWVGVEGERISFRTGRMSPEKFQTKKFFGAIDRSFIQLHIPIFSQNKKFKHTLRMVRDN